eukprot:1181471-Prorocentrum_minimum.AAC.2
MATTKHGHTEGTRVSSDPVRKRLRYRGRVRPRGCKGRCPPPCTAAVTTPPPGRSPPAPVNPIASGVSLQAEGFIPRGRNPSTANPIVSLCPLGGGQEWFIRGSGGGDEGVMRG